jgi:hypothetical protein
MLTDGQKLILSERKGYITGGQGPCGCAENVEIPRTGLSGVVKVCSLARRLGALRAERLKRQEMTRRCSGETEMCYKPWATYAVHQLIRMLPPLELEGACVKRYEFDSGHTGGGLAAWENLNFLALSFLFYFLRILQAQSLFVLGERAEAKVNDFLRV